METAEHAKIRSPHFEWRQIAFVVGVPVAMAVFSTVSEAERVSSVGFSPLLLFNLGHALIPWWAACLVTRGLMAILQRWRPGLLFLATGGVLLANLVTLPYVVWISHAFDTAFGQGQDLIPADWPYSAVYADDLFLMSLHSAIIWVLANFVFDRYLGLPRYRYDVAGSKETIADVQEQASPAGMLGSHATIAVDTRPMPKFLRRLSKPIQPQDIHFIKAEEHYIRVAHHDTDELVLYRFSDAVDELEPWRIGLRTHRSYWVSHAAIDNIITTGQKTTLHLKNGTNVPVSARYQGLLQQTMVRKD